MFSLSLCDTQNWSNSLTAAAEMLNDICLFPSLKNPNTELKALHPSWSTSNNKRQQG